MRIRPAAALLFATLLLVLVPGTALAHASFDVRQVPAGSTQDLVLRVPLERDAVNDLVEVLVPGSFTVDACDETPGWRCDQARTADGDLVLTLARDDDGPGDTEQFALTVTAPAQEGVYVFPTIQTYDDGVEAAWIEEPGTDQPAPRIQVGDESTEVESSGDATPHTDLATEEPAAGPTPTASEQPADEQAEGDQPSTDVDEDADDPTSAATDDDLVPDQADDGTSPFVLAAGVLLALVAIAGAVARFRSV